MSYQDLLRLMYTTHNHLESRICFSIIPRTHCVGEPSTQSERTGLKHLSTLARTRTALIPHNLSLGLRTELREATLLFDLESDSKGINTG